MVQCLRLHASTAGCLGSIPGQGTKILHAMGCSQKVKNKIKHGKFSKAQGSLVDAVVLFSNRSTWFVCFTPFSFSKLGLSKAAVTEQDFCGNR